jgi:hypothetical protein
MLSGGMMLITVTGRKTGKDLYHPGWILCRGGVPVGHHQPRTHSGGGICRAARRWVLLLETQTGRMAFAETETDERAVEARMYEYLRHVPQAAKPMENRTWKMRTSPIQRGYRAPQPETALFLRIKLAE